MKKLLRYLRAKRGRLTRLAEKLEVSPSTILTWKKIPAQRCIAIEEFTGISRNSLRPDIFGEENGKQTLSEVV